MNIKNRKIISILLLIIILFLNGCTVNDRNIANDHSIPLKEKVEKALGGNAGLVFCDLADLVDLIGLDETTIAECVYLTSADGLSAEEVIALRCTDEKHTSAVKEALEVYLNQRLRETQNYLPDIYAVLKNAKVQIKGNTVLLVTGEQANVWANAILAGE